MPTGDTHSIPDLGQSGPEVPVLGSLPIELPPEIPGDGSQVHEVAEATTGTFPGLKMDGWRGLLSLTGPLLSTYTGVWDSRNPSYP